MRKQQIKSVVTGFLPVVFLLLIISVLGCNSSYNTEPFKNVSGSTKVKYIHDDTNGVGCWLGYKSISCLPDDQYDK